MEFIQDEWNPYMQNLQRKQSLISGGLNNIVGGASGIVDGIAGQEYIDEIGAGSKSEAEKAIKRPDDPTSSDNPNQEGTPSKKMGFEFDPNEFGDFPAKQLPPNPERMFYDKPDNSPVRNPNRL